MIDLKGNTNFVALKNLQDEYVVPRTNLAAVDMDVANGLTVSGSTIGMEIADPLQLTTGASGNGVVNADVLKTALGFARASEFDANAQPYVITGNAATVTDTDGVRTIEAIPVEGVIALAIQGPMPVVSTVAAPYLIVVDVKSETGATSIGIATTGTQTDVDNYGTTSITTGVWTRLAFILDATAATYQGNLTLTGIFDTEFEGARSFSYKNLYIVDVTDLSDVYRSEMASVIGTDAAYVFKPGYGIDILDGTISTVLETADTKAVLDGEPDVLVSTKGLSSAISTGKAVDVTSDASVSAGTLDRGLSAKDPVTWTGTTGGNIGFYNEDTAFPKFADTLVYLILADVTNNGTANVVINGANGLNGTLPITITPQSTVRVAKIFTTQTDGYFSASSTASMNVTFKLREYEVTGCTNEARAYIAGLEDPDNYNDYYLVDQDSVNPWLNIINMKDSPYTTVMAGLAYKLYANDGQNHTIMVDTIPPNTFGREARLELFVGGTSDITLVAPLRLAHGNSFTANTLNNCSIRFQDGLATLTVDSVESSYIVNLAGGTYTTESGTLYAAINSDNDTILFNSDTDGLDCDMYGAISVVNVRLYGNGVANTILVGSGTFGTYQAKLNSLSFKGATVSGSAIEAEGDIGIVDKLTNNGAISVDPGVNVVVVGAATNSTAMDGTGTISFGNGCTIDASNNKTGGIVLGSANSTIKITGTTAKLISARGLESVLTTNSGKHYLFVSGVLEDTYLTVTTAAASGSGSLSSILEDTTNNTLQVIFDKTATDGQTINISGATCLAEHSYNGNGVDKTTITGATVKYDQVWTQFINMSIRDLHMERVPSRYGVVGFRGCDISTTLNTSLVNGKCSLDSCYIHDFYYPHGAIFSNDGGIGYSSGIINCVFENNNVNTIAQLQGDTLVKDSYLDGGLHLVVNSPHVENTTIAGTLLINTYDGGQPIITDCMLANISVTKPCPTFKGTNKVNGTINVLNTGSMVLYTDSILDLSENANSVVTIGTGPIYTGTDTGTKNSHVYTVTQAYVIPYGGTEKIQISGIGNGLLNDGKFGYLIKEQTGTGAGTLYDAFMSTGVAYTNNIFSTALNGLEISCSTPIDFTKTGLTFEGNGPENTIISGTTIRAAINYLNSGAPKFSNIGFNDVAITYATGFSMGLNIPITGCTVTRTNKTFFQANGQLYATDCYFVITADATSEQILNTGSGGSSLTRCRVISLRSGTPTNYGFYMAGTVTDSYLEAGVREQFGTYTISGSTFALPVLGDGLSEGYATSTGANITVEDCVFTSTSRIYLIGVNGKVIFSGTNVVDSVVYGGGLAVFAANSVLDLRGNENSTVISGGTISVDPSARVIPYNGTAPQAFTGSGNTLSNLGVLS